MSPYNTWQITHVIQLKKNKSRPAFPAIPGVWGEIIAGIKRISARTQNHISILSSGFPTQWNTMNPTLDTLDDAYCIYANPCQPKKINHF